MIDLHAELGTGREGVSASIGETGPELIPELKIAIPAPALPNAAW